MRIKVVVPQPDARLDLARRVARFDLTRVRPGTVLAFVATRDGPVGAGSPYDHALAEMATLDAGAGAGSEGYDAVVIDDASDPAMDALRSRLTMPVTGAGAASLWLGRLLGGPIAYVAPAEEVGPIERMLLLQAAEPGTAFVQAYDRSPREPEDERTGSSVAAAAEAARRGAACLALVGPAESRVAEIADATGLPTFGATLAAVKLAEVLVGLGLTQSPITYVPARQVQDDLLADRMRARPDVHSILAEATADRAPDRRVRVIVPHSDMDADAIARRADVIVPGLLHPGTRVDYTGTRTSPNRADSPYATLLMDLFCFDEGLRAIEAHPDAITIDSTTDSGIAALRSRAPMLVLGTGLATWSLAAAVADRFGILAMEPEWSYFYKKGVRAARLTRAYVGTRAVGVPTDPYNLFAGKEDDMFARLTGLGRSAIDEDGAEALVVGSTTMHQAGDHLAASLAVPVLNPGRVALRSIEAVLEMGLIQSRVTAPMPTTLNDGILT